MQTTTHNKCTDIAEFELADLRRAIAALPALDRGGFARLCILMLLIDMTDADRSMALGVLRFLYSPRLEK